MKINHARKLLVDYAVTSASANHGAKLPVLADRQKRVVHADCEYNRKIVRDYI